MVFMLFLVSWLATLLYPENPKYMWTSLTDFFENPTYIFWLFSFTLFLFSGCIDDVKQLTEVLEKVAYITVSLCLLYYVVAVAEESPPEYMSFSYSMQFSVALLAVLVQQKFTWKRMIFSIVGGVLILIAGCRGAMLGLLVSLFAYDWFSGKRRTQKEVLLRAGLVLLAVLMLISWRSVLETIAKILEELKISSRTIELLLEESLLDDSGRGTLTSAVSGKLSLFGYGLFGDRAVLNGSYVHNIVFEVLLDYGVLLGAVLLIVWLVLVIHGITGSKSEYRVLICALAASGFVKMFLSSSYLHWEPAFWLLVGLCIDNVCRKPFIQRSRLETAATDSSNG